MNIPEHTGHVALCVDEICFRGHSVWEIYCRRPSATRQNWSNVIPEARTGQKLTEYPFNIEAQSKYYTLEST